MALDFRYFNVTFQLGSSGVGNIGALRRRRNTPILSVSSLDDYTTYREKETISWDKELININTKYKEEFTLCFVSSFHWLTTLVFLI